MPHLRKRHLYGELKHQAKFWPVIGLLGLRQCGKSTVFREILSINHYTSLDDENSLEDAHLSAKNFLSKLGLPAVIDEAQKAPALFDAIKWSVDRNRRPGSYYLTGSSQFSSKLGIRESLTGRMGLNYLYPFTLAEAFEKPLEKPRIVAWKKQTPRFSIDDAIKKLSVGGLPVPLFTRDHHMRKRYFQSWLETALLRDSSRIYGKNYNPDVAHSILRQMGQTLCEGELPTLNHFKQNSRVLRRYLDAFENIFLLRKISCHEAGVGKEVWLPTDGGLACEIMGTELGEGATLSLSRIFLWNEILASCEAIGSRLRPLYYKSARGSPIDIIWQDTLIKVSVLQKSQLKYDERPLLGAMKTLKLKRGLLATLNDNILLEKNKTSSLGVVPITYWS